MQPALLPRPGTVVGGNSNTDNALNLLVAVQHGPKQIKEEGEEHESNHTDHSAEGFQIFHVEWERVEVPFLVGIWILATTVSKLGESTVPTLDSFPLFLLFFV